MIAKACETNTTLASIDLSHNSIGGHFTARGALHRTPVFVLLVNIGGAIVRNVGLRQLDLSTNEFGTEGALAVARAIETNMVLQVRGGGQGLRAAHSLGRERGAAGEGCKRLRGERTALRRRCCRRGAGEGPQTLVTH
jgi:hypothetical protein